MKEFKEPILTIVYFLQDSVFMSPTGSGGGNLDHGNEGDTDYDIIW